MSLAFLFPVLASILGVLLAALPSCLPGIHVYSLIAIVAALLSFGESSGFTISPVIFIPFCTGMLVAYSIFSIIPSIMLSSPDESAFFTVLPGRRYFLKGRGVEAVVITSFGAVTGLFFVCLLVCSFVGRTVGVVAAVIQPHVHWIIWCVICFMLMSEWPQAGNLQFGGWQRFSEAWKPLLAGMAVFVLSGLLGWILTRGNIMSVETSYQKMMPAFVGLFTLPWLVMNLFVSMENVGQGFNVSSVSPRALVHGGIAGIMGGSFAMLVPGVTGGVGGFLAGHASALNDDQTFLVSQGASRCVYYIGSFVLFFLPCVRMTRGGAASVISTVFCPDSYVHLYMTIGSVAVAAATVLLLLYPLVRISVKLVEKTGVRYMSAAGIFMSSVVVLMFGGLEGLLVMLTALGIGLFPPLFGTRRMNCLGIILLPLAIGM